MRLFFPLLYIYFFPSLLMLRQLKRYTFLFYYVCAAFAPSLLVSPICIDACFVRYSAVRTGASYILPVTRVRLVRNAIACSVVVSSIIKCVWGKRCVLVCIAPLALFHSGFETRKLHRCCCSSRVIWRAHRIWPPSRRDYCYGCN